MPREVFQYPTVKEVDFEIRFPHLFIIENKIGEYQESIISEFPDSQIVFERPLVFTAGAEGRLERFQNPNQNHPSHENLGSSNLEKATN